MIAGLKIAFFGSSLVSNYWNEVVTYYRGIIRALYERGHRITFYEPDVFERQHHRDIPNPPWARVAVYPAGNTQEIYRVLASARHADIVVKASDVGIYDELLEREVLALQRPGRLIVFWDVDAPATLDRVARNPHDPFRTLIPHYDLIFTSGGGVPVVNTYLALGARACVPIYYGLDPTTHYPVAPDARFEGMLGLLGDRLPDAEVRMHAFFFQPARHFPHERFLLAGNGWEQHIPELPNVCYAGHVSVCDHNAFNCTPHVVLNITREGMARYGFYPSPHIFEAAGAGACLITDAWEGIEHFLEPDQEVLVAHSSEEVVTHLLALTSVRRAAIGHAAWLRVLHQHTYVQRAAEVEAALLGQRREQGTGCSAPVFT